MSEIKTAPPDPEAIRGLLFAFSRRSRHEIVKLLDITPASPEEVNQMELILSMLRKEAEMLDNYLSYLRVD